MTAMRRFVPSPAIIAQAAIDIAAPPGEVAMLYCAVEKWSETFAATIEQAHVTQAGDTWKRIEVLHKREGWVPNTLILLSGTEIWLEESKKLYDACFLNQFEPAVGGGTHYLITAYIRLKGIFGVVQPLLGGYVRRRALAQMRRYVLDPLKNAAEQAP
jgi:hypothetical protein